MAEGKGISVAKVMLGCGCLSVLIGGGIALALFFGGVLFVQSKAEEHKEELEAARDLWDTGKQLKEQARRQEQRAASGNGGHGQDFQIDRAEMIAWPTRSLSAEDVDAHVAFMEAWEGSDAVKNLKKSRETFQDLSKKDKQGEGGALEGMRALNATKNMMLGASAWGEEFEALAAKHGGAEEVLRRYFQVVAVSAAARGIATHHDGLEDPSSGGVAARMLSEHGDWQRRHAQWRESMRDQYAMIFEMQKDPKAFQEKAKSKAYQEQLEQRGELAKIQSESPGLLLLGRLPHASLETWEGLAPARRKALLEEHTKTLFVPMMALAPAQMRDPKLVAQQLLSLELAKIHEELRAEYDQESGGEDTGAAAPGKK